MFLCVSIPMSERRNSKREGYLQYKKEKEPEMKNAVDELKKYKELFDSGVITQEEFDAKKKQILNL